MAPARSPVLLLDGEPDEAERGDDNEDRGGDEAAARCREQVWPDVRGDVELGGQRVRRRFAHGFDPTWARRRGAARRTG